MFGAIHARARNSEDTQRQSPSQPILCGISTGVCIILSLVHSLVKVLASLFWKLGLTVSTVRNKSPSQTQVIHGHFAEFLTVAVRLASPRHTPLFTINSHPPFKEVSHWKKFNSFHFWTWIQRHALSNCKESNTTLIYTAIFRKSWNINN